MGTEPSKFRLVAEYPGWSIALNLPSWVFSQLAEQLRWDSLRVGHIGLAEWSTIKAYVTCWPRDEFEPNQVKIDLLIEGRRNPVSKCYDTSKLQRFDLFVQSSCHRLVGKASQSYEQIKLEWVGPEIRPGLPVPLSPLRVPAVQPIVLSKSRSYLRPLRLIVSEQVELALRQLSEQSLSLGVELGGCLVGQMPDKDTVSITEIVSASQGAGSEAQFKFEPHFWLRVNSRLADTGLHIFGWYHSHLCDEGYPASLSRQDLAIFHNHFAAPWSVGALVCASFRHPAVKWFGWKDGNVVALEISPKETPAYYVTGGTPCQQEQ